MPEYRIEWINFSTNIKGHGDWFPMKDKTMLENNIKHYNKEYHGQIIHTLAQK